MATFEIWYSETYTYKAWFNADDKEAALAMLEQVRDGEADLEELPNFGNKDKGYELELDIASVEELK